MKRAHKYLYLFTLHKEQGCELLPFLAFVNKCHDFSSDTICKVKVSPKSLLPCTLPPGTRVDLSDRVFFRLHLDILSAVGLEVSDGVSAAGVSGSSCRAILPGKCKTLLEIFCS